MYRFALLAVLLTVVCSTAVMAADRWNEPASFGYVPLLPVTPQAMVMPYVSWQSEMWFADGTARLEEVSWMPACRGTVPLERDIYEGETAFEIVPVAGVEQTLFFLQGIPGIKFMSTVPVANIPIRIVEKKNSKVTRIWERKFLVHFFSSPRKGPFRPMADIAPLL